MQKVLKKYFLVFTLPTLIAFAIAFVLPFVFGVYLSFCSFRTVSDTKWVGLDNYIKAFTVNKEFFNALIFTVKFAIVSLLSINVFAFLLSMVLTRGLKGTNLFRTVFLCQT